MLRSSELLIYSLVSVSFLFPVMFMGVDRVFRGDCTTREVYDEGIKDIALSVVGGINCEYYYIHEFA